jgi:hypothetical protein
MVRDIVRGTLIITPVAAAVTIVLNLIEASGPVVWIALLALGVFAALVVDRLMDDGATTHRDRRGLT